MRKLRLVPLSQDRAALAYPLIQTVRPALSLEAWEEYATGILQVGADGSGGIMTLQNPRGLIAGLFVYRIEEVPDHGRTLVAEDFVALDIIDSEVVAESLADALEQVAREHGCQAVHTSITCNGGPGSRRVVDLMRRLGHHVESFRMCKPLPATG
jgi:hypothetical protein